MAKRGMRVAGWLLLAVAGNAANETVGAAQIQFDLNTTGPCKALMTEHCEKIARGAGRKAICLNQQRPKMDNPPPQACLDEIKLVLANLAKFPFVSLQGACDAERKTHCAEMQGSEAFDCVKDLMTPGPQGDPDGNTNAVSAKCRDKVLQLERQQAQNMELDDPFYQACKYDLSTVKPCNTIEAYAPLAGKKACLMNHKKELSGTCSTALFKRLQNDMRDVRLMPVVFQSCRAEIKQLCGGLQFGEARVLKCLWQNEHGITNYNCQKQVHEVTKHKLSDYRLDFRIRTRCAKDITTLCQNEQWRVDNLTVQELFGGTWWEGQSGLVLQCLKANFTKIATPACKPEIQRLVKAHAESPDLDPVYSRLCKDDISRFCNKTKPERIHFCMRIHLDKLQPECQSLEIVQGSISAMDVNLKPAMKKACAQAIPKFCRDVTHGDAQVIQCLQDHMEEEGMGRECLEVVELDLEASNHDWRLKFGVHHACMVDAGRLCHQQLAKGHGAVLECLKENRTRISSSSCKAEVFRYTQQTLSNIKFAPHTYAACLEDVNAYCKNVTPGQGRVHACLVSHKNQLSFNCSTTEFKEHMHMAEDYRLHPKARIMCKNSAKLLCPDIPYGEGRVWTCLSKKKDDPTMAQGCRLVVTSHERLQNYEFQLNPQMKKYCSKDAVRLCPFQAAMADSKQFGSEGAAIGCLISKRKEVQNTACKGILLQKAIQRLASIDNSPDAHFYCEEDVQRFCPSAERNGGHGEIHKCLKKHLKNLTVDCRTVQMDFTQMEMEDARLLPFMGKECSAAKNRYCKDVSAGEGRQVVCMLKHMHDKTMEPGCKQKLVGVQKLRATSIRFNPLLATYCKEDLQELQKKHDLDANCVAHDDQDVALTGLSINCLTNHVGEVKKTQCKSALHTIQTMQSNDLRAKPMMQKACTADITALCPGVEAGEGRWHQCLRTNIGRISDSKCKTMVKSVWEAEKSDIVLNPHIRGRCQNELRAFCPDVERGEQRLLVCLMQHRKLSGFSEGCETALQSLGVNVTLPVAQSTIQELLHKRSFWDKWGTVLIGGIAVLLTIWIVALGFLIRWLRSSRTLYGIQVDTPEKEEQLGERA